MSLLFYSMLLLECLLLCAYLARARRFSALLLFLALFGLHMALNLLEMGLGRDMTSLAAPLFSTLYGPLLYLFSRELSYQDFRLRPRHLLHGVPMLVTAAVSLAGFESLVPLVGLSTFLGYLGAAVFGLLRAQGEIRNVTSSPWVASPIWLAWVFGVFLLAGMVDGSARLFFEPQSWIGLLLQGVALALILANLTAMVWRSMNHTQVLRLSDLEGIAAAQGSASTVDGASPDAGEDVAARLTALEEAFNEDALHLRPRLSVQEVADRLGWQPREVSRLINQSLGKSFADFVNEKRVGAAMEKMADPAEASRSLLQIAFDVGFNSKTAFHDSFRKVTGSSPAAWSRSRKKGESSG